MNEVEIQPIPDTLFRDIMETRAREEPEAVYLRFNGVDMTVAQVNAAANRLANALLARGLNPGDRVGLMLPNHPHHVIAIFALMKAGLVRVPVNVNAKGPSLEHYFTSYDPHFLIADHGYRDVLADMPVPQTVWRGPKGSAEDGFAALLAHEDDSCPTAPIDPDAMLAMTPSSGTTGAPKGVLKSDRTLRAGPHCILELTAARKGDVFLLWEPLHHGAGVAVTIAAMIGGITLAMVERFSVSRFWDQVRDNGVTHIHYLGGVLPLLLKQEPSEKERDHKVRIAWGGGCPPEIWDRVEKRFGVELREGYGLSELITFVTLNKDGRKGSCGLPISLYEIKVVDAEGNETAPGVAGEMVARARQKEVDFLGYFRNEAAAREAVKDGWFHTGDLARRDEDGYLYYAGRTKEMVRRRGVNISAWEVEQVVNKFAGVAESALVGVPSEVGEDDLKIVVRAAGGQPFDPLDLIRF